MEKVSDQIITIPKSDTPVENPKKYSRRDVISTMVSLFLMMLFASLDQDVTATAMPHIVGELHGFDLYTWVTTAYMLTSTIMIPIYGKLSDLFGRKIVLIVCLILFLAGSALSGASQSIEFLIFCRAFQGLGAAGIPAVAMATIGDLFSLRERGKWMGAFGSVIGISSIIGPIVGGWITDHASWRWVFFINLPVGLLALLVLIFFMPSLRRPRTSIQVDYIGAALLAGGTTPLLLGLSWAGSRYPWLSWQTIALMGGGLLVLLIFAFYEIALERRAAEPIITPSMFKNRLFTTSLGCVLASFTGLFGSVIFLPLYLQGVLGVSATVSGLVMTPMMFAVIAGFTISGQLLSRTGKYKLMAITGMCLAICGVALFLHLTPASNYLEVIIGLAVLGLGAGIGMGLYGTVIQAALPERTGEAGATMEFFEQIGGPLALSIMGSLLAFIYAPAFYAALTSQVRQLVPTQLLRLFEQPDILLNPDFQHSTLVSFSSLGQQGNLLFQQTLNAVKLGLFTSIHATFFVGLVILCLGLLLACFLPVVELPPEQSEQG